VRLQNVELTDTDIDLAPRGMVSSTSGAELTSATWEIDPPTDWTYFKKNVSAPSGESAGGWASGADERSILIYEFEMRRNAIVSELSLIMPTCLYWIISYTGFFLSPMATPARATLHALPVLMMVNQLVKISSDVPHVSYPIWIMKFVFSFLLLAVMHMMAFGMHEFARGFGEGSEMMISMMERMALLSDPSMATRGLKSMRQRVHSTLARQPGVAPDLCGENMELGVDADTKWGADGVPSGDQAHGSDDAKLGPKKSLLQRAMPQVIKVASHWATHGDLYNRIFFMTLFVLDLGILYSEGGLRSNN
jgi:hypothetical protein